MREQIVEQGQCLGGQLERPVAKPGTPGHPIEQQLTAAERTGGGQRGPAGSGATQHRPDPGHQLQRVERFVQIVVGALLERHRPLAGVTDLREQDDRGAAATGAERAEHLAAVPAGHEHVQHTQVRVVRVDRRQCGLPVVGHVDGEPGPLEQGSQVGSDRLLIVGEHHNGPFR